MSQGLLIAVVVCLLLLGIAVAYMRFQSKKNKKLLAQGLIAILALRDLIVLVQKHRGWSAAYASGDQSVSQKTTELKANIRLVNQSLQQDFKLAEFDRWLAYFEHWQRLSENAFLLSATDNFKQHTQLIGCMLYLLEDVAQAYGLTAEIVEKSASNKMMWRDLLHLSEFIGQARALGTGMTTQKSYSRIDRNKLISLRHRITELSEDIYQRLAERGLTEESSAKVAAASKLTRYLCSAIEHELIEAEQIELSRDSYFQLATNSIEAVNQIFDDELKRIEQYT